MRVGVIGTGHMGGVHVRAWRALGVEVSVFSRDAGRAAALAEPHGARAFTDLDALLAHVEVADVCLPTFLHREVVERAARAGRHVVCEKPLALTEQDGEAMIEACRAAGVRLFVAMVLRFFPQYRAAREVVRSGGIGAPTVLRLRRIGSPPAGGTSWFAQEAQSGGVILDLMLHDIDYARWLAGDVTRVYARLNAVGARQYAQAVLTHASGATSLLESGWANPDGVFRTALDLAGDAGVIEWSSDAPPPVRALHREGRAPIPEPGPPSPDDPYVQQLRHVLDALQSGAPFEVTPEDALASLRVAIAARDAARSGRAVTLEARA